MNRRAPKMLAIDNAWVVTSASIPTLSAYDFADPAKNVPWNIDMKNIKYRVMNYLVFKSYSKLALSIFSKILRIHFAS
jgi:hypothetical protein